MTKKKEVTIKVIFHEVDSNDEIDTTLSEIGHLFFNCDCIEQFEIGEVEEVEND
jgi:hypothetical protein